LEIGAEQKAVEGHRSPGRLRAFLRFPAYAKRLGLRQPSGAFTSALPKSNPDNAAARQRKSEYFVTERELSQLAAGGNVETIWDNSIASFQRVRAAVWDKPRSV
jgi:hypothetical protein